MQKTGSLDLPLHGGKAPRWLFERMYKLSRNICEIILIEFGRSYLLERLSSPDWFQSFGCVLGFDWHSSGLTTTVCAALKKAFNDLGDSGMYVCGGKGATSRRTPQEIQNIAERLGRDPDKLIYASKLAAKVDNNALQDGFDLYHHSFIFTDEFEWGVVQQGMSQVGHWARRYHWFSKNFTSFIDTPHQGIVSEKSFLTLNMVDHQKNQLRDMVRQLASRRPEENFNDLSHLKEEIKRFPSRHQVLLKDVNPKYVYTIFLRTYERQPQDFENLLSLKNVGKKTIRALALISDLIYGQPLSFRDPARFSFAHGGKDGYPYRIQLADYNKSIEVLGKLIAKSKIDHTDKVKSLRRLHALYMK